VVRNISEGLRLAQEITLTYRWLGGAVLTDRDLESINLIRAGKARGKGFEYLDMVTPNELASLSLCVQVPASCAPEVKDVELFCKPPGNDGEIINSNDQDGPELKSESRHVGPGTFYIEIPYPLKGFRYGLAWPLTKESPNGHLTRDFLARLAAEPIAKDVLREFLHSLNLGAVTFTASAALYVPTIADRQILKRLTFVAPWAAQTDDYPPELVSLRDEDSPYRLSWWGDIVGALRDNPQESGKSCFIGDECAVVMVPIKSFQRREIEIPWCLIRIGFHGEGDEVQEYVQKSFESFHFAALATAVTIQKSVNQIFATGRNGSGAAKLQERPKPRCKNSRFLLCSSGDGRSTT
jgi:hypothetical protein